MKNKSNLIFVIIIFIILITNCSKEKKSLLLYVGKSLKGNMSGIKSTFEKKYNIDLKILYGCSHYLLDVIKETGEGDILIPGTCRPIIKNSELVYSYQIFASRIPIIAVNKNNPVIESFKDLGKPGIKLSINNKKLCPFGEVCEKIILKSGFKNQIEKNIVIKVPTIIESFNLLINKEIDATFIWKDMLLWSKAKSLKGIEIPANINEAQEIPIILLNTSKNKKKSQLFIDFISKHGSTIFN